MCAGSLALGCQILGIFATRSQVYGAHGCHLACLVPLLWRPGVPWDDPGTILGHWRAQGRTLWGPGLDSIDFLLISATDFESFLGSFGPKKKIFSYLFSGCFFWWFLGLNLGVRDCKNKHLAWKVLQKSTFAEIGFLVIPGTFFHDFGWPWDQFSWPLLPWRLAWKLMDFQGCPEGRLSWGNVHRGW